jgi:hypothetical protein
MNPMEKPQKMPDHFVYPLNSALQDWFSMLVQEINALKQEKDQG